MVYAALADKAGDNPLDGHYQILQDWELYGEEFISCPNWRYD